jgi:hypothetical protein
MLSKNPFVRYDHFFPNCLGEQPIPFLNGLQNKQVFAVWSPPGWGDLFLFLCPKQNQGPQVVQSLSQLEWTPGSARQQYLKQRTENQRKKREILLEVGTAEDGVDRGAATLG